MVKQGQREEGVVRYFPFSSLTTKNGNLHANVKTHRLWMTQRGKGFWMTQRGKGCMIYILVPYLLVSLELNSTEIVWKRAYRI